MFSDLIQLKLKKGLKVYQTGLSGKPLSTVEIWVEPGNNFYKVTNR